MKATFYVQFKPQWVGSSGRIYAIKAAAISQHKPTAPRGGHLLVKFVAEIEDSAFTVPTVTVAVPAAHGEVAAETMPVQSDEEGTA